MTCEDCSGPRPARARYCAQCAAARRRARAAAAMRRRRSTSAHRQAERNRDRKRDPQRKDSPAYRAANAERMRRRRAQTSTTDITRADLAHLYSAKRCPLCDTAFDPNPTDPHGQHLDHILPISQGGAHLLANVRVICATCNVRRPRHGTDDVQVALWAGNPTVIETLALATRDRRAAREHPRKAAALRRYAARARQAEALTLRAMGCRWRDIADHLGYANTSGPYLAAKTLAARTGVAMPRRFFDSRRGSAGPAPNCETNPVGTRPGSADG